MKVFCRAVISATTKEEANKILEGVAEKCRDLISLEKKEVIVTKEAPSYEKPLIITIITIILVVSAGYFITRYMPVKKQKKNKPRKKYEFITEK